MRSSTFLSVASLLVGSATASFDGNLNYHSPSRRHSGLGINVPLVSRRSWKRQDNGYEPSQLNFTHGVASGDPLANSVILWTRIAPSVESNKSNVTVEGVVDLYSHETEAYIKQDANPICVDWKVYEADGDEPSDNAVAEGKAYTTSDIDFTLKVSAKIPLPTCDRLTAVQVDADGLEPFTQYFYQFSVCGSDTKSPMGRTKTAPSEDQDVDEIDLAVFSCGHHGKRIHPIEYGTARLTIAKLLGTTTPMGMRHARTTMTTSSTSETTSMRELAMASAPIILLMPFGLSMIIVLVTANTAPIPICSSSPRTSPGSLPGTTTVSREFPSISIAILTKSEIANNGYRDGFSALNNTEDSFLNDGIRVSVDTRKVHAVRAYFEWMPIRQVDLDDNLRIWRSFKMGKLMDLIILDTRNYDRSITGLG